MAALTSRTWGKSSACFPHSLVGCFLLLTPPPLLPSHPPPSPELHPIAQSAKIKCGDALKHYYFPSFFPSSLEFYLKMADPGGRRMGMETKRKRKKWGGPGSRCRLCRRWEVTQKPLRDLQALHRCTQWPRYILKGPTYSCCNLFLPIHFHGPVLLLGFCIFITESSLFKVLRFFLIFQTI